MKRREGCARIRCLYIPRISWSEGFRYPYLVEACAGRILPKRKFKRLIKDINYMDYRSVLILPCLSAWNIFQPNLQLRQSC